MSVSTAAYCQLGHVIAADVDAETRERIYTSYEYSIPTLDREPLPNFCKRCGTKVLVACSGCESPIPRPVSSKRPVFCEQCGRAYPWATREQIVGQLYARVDFDDLDEPSRLLVAEALSVLSNPEWADDDDKQVEAAGVFKRLAPGAWDTAKPVLVGVLTKAVQTKLGL